VVLETYVHGGGNVTRSRVHLAKTTEGLLANALLISHTPDSTVDGVDQSRKGTNMPKLSLYCGDYSLPDR
jgi:hypothetical protein